MVKEILTTLILAKLVEHKNNLNNIRNYFFRQSRLLPAKDFELKIRSSMIYLNLDLILAGIENISREIDIEREKRCS